MAETEQMGSEALEIVRGGDTLMRIENETLMAAAISHPRKEQEILIASLRELELVPELASTAYYSIPHRDVQEDGTVKIVQVTGPSIKSANALARRWGNCSVSCRVVGEDDATVDVEGVFLDFETMYRRTAPIRISKTFKRRNGRVEVLTENRLTQRVQAGVSKAIRNAVLGALPPYLVQAYDRRARQIVGGNPDEPAAEKVVQAVVATFAKIKVTDEMLEHYTDKPIAKWTGFEVAELRGLWNAIQDGQATIAEVFGGEGASAVNPDLMPKSTETPKGTDEPKNPVPPADDEAALAEEARKREEAEAATENRAGENAEQPTNGPLNRPAIFQRLRDKAREQNVKEITLLKSLTGKTSMAQLDEAECRKLQKALA